jgi:hypothetical protein
MELTVTKEKVLEAAKTSDSAKEALKVLFPEVFKVEPEYYDFGKEIKLNHLFLNGPLIEKPLMIAAGVAMKNDECKVLILNIDYELEVIPNYYNIFTGLKFKKKN